MGTWIKNNKYFVSWASAFQFCRLVPGPHGPDLFNSALARFHSRWQPSFCMRSTHGISEELLHMQFVLPDGGPDSTLASVVIAALGPPRLPPIGKLRMPANVDPRSTTSDLPDEQARWEHEVD